ncbi:hypothetical protein ABZY31_17255 [Streptomyces sp. NPDC006529]
MTEEHLGARPDLLDGLPVGALLGNAPTVPVGSGPRLGTSVS